jgi:serine/threonine protein kinase
MEGAVAPRAEVVIEVGTGADTALLAIVHVDIAVEIARRLLRGLAKLHESDLIHRDIKPSNIIFVNRYPKLADIGILTEQEGCGKPIGTPKYMPPDRATDKTADIYAIGTVLREMIEGGKTGPAGSVAYDSAKWDPDRVRSVIARACAGRAVDRYPTASAMLEDLEACLYEDDFEIESNIVLQYAQ